MKHIFLGVAVGLVALGAQAQTFTNISSSLPGTYNSGNCVGFTDMDNDGLDDLVVLHLSKNLRVLYQQPDGSFTEQAYGAVSTANQWGMTVADFDNNGHKDVFCGGSYDGVHVKRIESIGTVVDMQLANGQMFMQACNFADIDNDGQLDVFGCHDDGLSRMWRGEGSNLVAAPELMDLTDYALAGYPGNDHSGNYGTVWSDFDGDGDLDLMIAKCRQFINNPADPRRLNQLWVNDGSNFYAEDANARGLVYPEQSWTADFADIDNDGDFDCFITTHSSTMKLLENDGNGYFTDITAGSGVDVSGFVLQAKLADFDNDGFVDVVLGGGADGYFHNNGDQTFTAMEVFPAGDVMHSFAMGDVNRDGFLDLYASYGNGYNQADMANPDRLWLNNGNSNHWIAFDLQGIISNKDAVGTKVVITGDFGTQVREVRSGESYGITNTFSCMFGLGSHTSVDQVMVYWPSGLVTTINDPAIDTYHGLLEAPCQIAVTIQASALEFCPGGSVTLTAPAGFNQYTWSGLGSTSATATVSEAGSYSVTVFDAAGCAGVSNTVSVVEVTGEAPTITASGDLVLCAGQTLDLIASSAANWTWSTGATSQSIAVTESGEYFVTATDICGNVSASETLVVEVFASPSEPAVSGPVVGPPGLTWELVGNSESLHWYDAPNATTPIFIGSVFTTPIVNESTTFWVEDVLESVGSTGQGGELTTDAGQMHNNSTYYLIFDAYEDIVIESVKVFANGAGVRTIAVVDENDVVLASGDYNIPDGESEVALNLFVPAGSNYGLSCITDNPQLWRDGLGSSLNYPYAIGDLASITKSSVTGNNTYNYYYFFYDWEVSTPTVTCTSERVAVEVLIVGVEEEMAEGVSRVFPVPTSDVLFVEWNGTPAGLADVRMIDGMGRLVKEWNRLSWDGAGRLMLDLSDLAPGRYSLQMMAGGRQWVKQVEVR